MYGVFIGAQLVKVKFRALKISDGECSDNVFIDQEDANVLNLRVVQKVPFILKMDVGKVLIWEVFLKDWTKQLQNYELFFEKYAL